MPIIHALLISILALSAGCGWARGEHRMLPSADLIPPKSMQSAQNVQVLPADAGLKPGCVGTALLVANGNGYATREDLEATLQKEAFAVGADIVFIGPSGSSSMQVGTYGGGIALGQTIQYPHLGGLACRTASVWHGIRFHTKPKEWTVRYVYDASPAQQADIREGDEILTVNGFYLGDDPIAWHREMNAKPAGTTVPIQLLRGNNKQIVQLVLAPLN